MDFNPLAALIVSVIGVILLLGYLSTDVGSHWGTVQTGVLTVFMLATLAIISIGLAVRN